MLAAMAKTRNPLGFMGTGGIFKRKGWWYIQYRDPQTKRNMQIKVSQKKSDATVRLALLMTGVYERRIERLYEIVEKARPGGLLPEDASYRSHGTYAEYVFNAPRKGHSEYHALFGRPAADERPAGGGVPGPVRAVGAAGDGGGEARMRQGGQEPAPVRPRNPRPVRGTTKREGLK
jgi:hypothetical protein